MFFPLHYEYLRGLAILEEDVVGANLGSNIGHFLGYGLGMVKVYVR
jgi:hypothetical protein